MLNLTAAL